MSTTGDDRKYDQLVKSLMDQYSCAICYRDPPILQPVSLKTDTKRNENPCSHVFCLECIREYAGMNKRFGERKQVSCPICKKKVFGSLRGYACKNAYELYSHWTAGWPTLTSLIKIKWGDQGAPCIKEHLGCEKRFQNPAEIKRHLYSECEYVNAPCKWCHKHMVKSEHKAHLEVCPRRPIICRLCSQNVLHRDMNYHLSYYHSITNLESLNKLLDN